MPPPLCLEKRSLTHEQTNSVLLRNKSHLSRIHNCQIGNCNISECHNVSNTCKQKMENTSPESIKMVNKNIHEMNQRPPINEYSQVKKNNNNSLPGHGQTNRLGFPNHIHNDDSNISSNKQEPLLLVNRDERKNENSTFKYQSSTLVTTCNTVENNSSISIGPTTNTIGKRLQTTASSIISTNLNEIYK